MTSPNLVTWQCVRCRETGNLPLLDDRSIVVVREAIARGHERRAPDCHAAHGITHVLAGHGDQMLLMIGDAGQ